jgi:DNA-binding beta-propeller fold protein YncE
MKLLRQGVVAFAVSGLMVGVSAPAASASGSFLGSLTTVTTLASTVPARGAGAGDVNPYGVAVVPRSVNRLHAGSVLVSNFNAASNLQGTGTTIMQISASGHAELFARIDPRRLPGRCPGGVGLTTALSALSSGWVVVGSLPTTDGTAATAKAGCLLMLDSHGTVRRTIAGGLINGPWDMTAADHGNTADLFVTNVLNGTVAGGGAVINRGTVVRIHLRLHDADLPVVESTTLVGSGFSERTDPAALVVGPTGLALDRRRDVLYVSDTASNRIGSIPDARTRMTTAFSGADVTANGKLNSPLGLALAPNGHLLSVNAADGLIVETTPEGDQVAAFTLDTSGAPPATPGSGALFGLAATPDGKGVYFVDDATNTLDLLH